MKKNFRFFTAYTYDPDFYPCEVNDGPILVDEENYEPLSEKIRRYTSIGYFPRVSDDQYCEEYYPEDDFGFDPADLEEYDDWKKEQMAAKSPNKPSAALEAEGGVGPHIASATTEAPKAEASPVSPSSVPSE